jgi:hypothetical protein
MRVKECLSNGVDGLAVEDVGQCSVQLALLGLVKFAVACHDLILLTTQPNDGFFLPVYRWHQGTPSTSIWQVEFLVHGVLGIDCTHAYRVRLAMQTDWQSLCPCEFGTSFIELGSGIVIPSPSQIH